MTLDALPSRSVALAGQSAHQALSAPEAGGGPFNARMRYVTRTPP
jgi:hypothetical protein